MNNKLFAGAALGVLVMAAGCTATAEGAPSRTTPFHAELPSPEPSALVVRFGEAIEYPDGLVVTVSNGGSFAIKGDVSGGEEYPTNALLTITVENGTKGVLDLSMAQGDMLSGGAAGDEIFSEDPDIGGFTTFDAPPIPPGKSLTWEEGYGIMDPSDVSYSFQATWDYEPAMFASDGL